MAHPSGVTDPQLDLLTDKINVQLQVETETVRIEDMHLHKALRL
jgi:hypothetical protein